MSTRKSRFLALLFAFTAIGMASAVAAQVLKQEPPMGKLREGQTVLVNDGSCPAGQIMQVTGGNHVKVGGTKQVVRHKRCIPH